MKWTVRRVLAKAVLSLSLIGGPGHAHAGIPVIDVAALIQAVLDVFNGVTQVANQITSIANEYTQIVNQYQQIKQLGEQITNISGWRDLGNVLNNRALQFFIPAESGDTFARIRTSGNSALSATAQALRQSNSLYNCMDLTGDQRTACQASLARPYESLALFEGGFNKAQDRMQQINDLLLRINTTVDQKGILELQGRIQGETALLQQELAQIELARGMTEAAEQVDRARDRELQLEQASRTGRLADFMPK